MGDDLVRELLREGWVAFEEAGGSIGQPVRVRAHASAPSEALARIVSAALEAEGWETCLETTRTGLLRRRVEWSVTGIRTVPYAGVAGMDDLVDHVEALATRCGADFAAVAGPVEA